MPLYEYKCQGCGQVFEIIQRFSDEPLTTHEVCGGTVERLISAPGLHFKGSGWYVTDYAKGGANPANSNKNGGSSNESKSGDSKSGDSKSSDSKSGDSKPAASSSESSKSSSSSSSTDTK